MRIIRKGGRAEFPFLVAIETDPERIRDGKLSSNATLKQGDAEQLLSHLAADLGTLLGGIGKCRVATAGALYDQCQVLRPGTPLIAALSAELADDQLASTTPGLTAVGAEDGAMPAETLQPDEDIPPAPLRMLPLLISGPEALITDLAGEMEHRFLAEGQVSAHTASWLESAFGTGISHARFMTLTDLNAMLRLQLEHFGYLPLWELVDAAVNGASECSVTTDNGTAFGCQNGKVRATFQTFDYWASHGQGSQLEDEQSLLSQGYVDWTREFRRYTSTLSAHHVPMVFELPAECDGQAGEEYLYETRTLPESSRAPAAITEHDWPELGTVAITVRTAGVLRHYYPLTAQGLNDIQDVLKGLELDGEGMAFPGSFKIDETNRRLRPMYFEA